MALRSQALILAPHVVVNAKSVNWSPIMSNFSVILFGSPCAASRTDAEGACECELKASHMNVARGLQNEFLVPHRLGVDRTEKLKELRRNPFATHLVMALSCLTR